jgi:hypothetical protein
VNRWAFLAVAIICVGVAPVLADEHREYRVAAIIFAEQNSKALIEDASGKQAWYRTGEDLGQAKIVGITVDSVMLNSASGESTLLLRGSKRTSRAVQDEAPAPAAEVSREYRYVGLMSELEAAEPGLGETQASSDGRTMNRIFGLADKAKITAVDRVEVSTAAEARAELQQRLTSSEPIRITIEGDELKVLYVTPN